MNRCYTYFLFLLAIYEGLHCKSQVSKGEFEKETLVLVTKVILPGVNGRIDHIAYDSTNHRVFIAALGNNSVEVVNIFTKQVVQTISGLHEPQGIIYIPSLKKFVVANGGNGDCIFFDGVTYGQLAVIHLKKDADNIRYEGSLGRLYVGYGDGAIAVIDAAMMKQVGDIGLDGHPESFQLSKQKDRIFINVPDEDEVEVGELSSNKIVTKWPNKGIASNFPMAMDELNNRLFVGCRSPAKLEMINFLNRKETITADCSGDADDVFYYDRDSLVIVSAGKGFIDVFRAGDNSLTRINHIQTRRGARTSFLLQAEKKFLLAVPAQAGKPAELWIYNII